VVTTVVTTVQEEVRSGMRWRQLRRGAVNRQIGFPAAQRAATQISSQESVPGSSQPVPPVTVTVGERLWRKIETVQGADGGDAAAAAPAGNRSPLISDDDLAEDDLGGCEARARPTAMMTAP